MILCLSLGNLFFLITSYRTFNTQAFFEPFTQKWYNHWTKLVQDRTAFSALMRPVSDAPFPCSLKQRSPACVPTRDQFCGGPLFHRSRVGSRGWFQDDSSTLHLLYNLFLLVLHLRSSDITSWRLGTPTSKWSGVLTFRLLNSDAVCPLYLQVPHPWIQAATGWKYF